MNRYADWSGTPRPRRLFGCFGGGALLVLGFAILMVLLLATSPTFDNPVIFVLMAPVMVLFPVAGLRAAEARAIEKLREALVADRGETPVRIVVEFPGGPTLGADYGFLCAEDGWLVFRGERTEWAVSRRDVEYDRVLSLLRYPTQGGITARVRLDGLDGKDERAVVRLLDEWIVGPEADGNSVFPPIRRAPASPFGRWLAMGVGLLIVGLFSVVPEGYRTFWIVVFGSLGLLGSLVHFSHERRMRRALGPEVPERDFRPPAAIPERREDSWGKNEH